MRGCKYQKTGRALKLHIELKEEDAHARYREANGIAQPKGPNERVPGAAGEVGEKKLETEPAADVESEPAGAEPAAGSSEIVAELDEPPAGPLVSGGPRGPPADPGEGGGGGPSTFAGEERGELRELDDSEQGAREVGQVRQYLHATAPWKKQANRFVRGSINRWAIDPKLGDTPISKEEIEEFDIPALIEYTADWIAEQYGFDPDFDHPAVGWAMVALGIGGLVMEHRAPRPKKGDLSQPAEPEKPALPEATEEIVAPVEPEDEPSEISGALDAALGRSKA